MTITVLPGDSREILTLLPDDSIDSVLTDPPYALVSIGKRFSETSVDDDTQTSVKAKNRVDAYARASAGFMGKKWDTGETAFADSFWREVYRVLKPGGHMLVFGGTRTYHRLVCAIEDAGFEIRDMVAWTYGTGFPKSHDVSKGIDKHFGQNPVPASVKTYGDGHVQNSHESIGYHGSDPDKDTRVVTMAVSDEAKQWQGWGTALKPALEPICLARKPLIGTVAENVLTHGTGAINIDASRIATGNETPPTVLRRQSARDNNWDATGNGVKAKETDAIGRMQRRGNPETFKQERPSEQLGRFPANLIHDGSEEVVALFPDSKGQQADAKTDGLKTRDIYGAMDSHPFPKRNDSGSAARFFYCAKASKHDRRGSKHPTVKPISLLRYLVRLITPPGGTVLDPFAGSGTTGEAALLEGFHATLIEREEEYVADIERRIAGLEAAE